MCGAAAAGKGAGREVRQQRLETLHTPFSPSVRPPALSACSQALFGDRFSHPCSSIELFYFRIGNHYFVLGPGVIQLWLAEAGVEPGQELRRPPSFLGMPVLHTVSTVQKQTNKQAAAFTSRLSSQLFLNMVSFTKPGESLVFS